MQVRGACALSGGGGALAAEARWENDGLGEIGRAGVGGEALEGCMVCSKPWGANTIWMKRNRSGESKPSTFAAKNRAPVIVKL